jgi:hypothetical protein
MRVKSHIVDIAAALIAAYIVIWSAIALQSWTPVIIAAFIGLVVLVYTITNPKGRP